MLPPGNGYGGALCVHGTVAHVSQWPGLPYVISFSSYQGWEVAQEDFLSRTGYKAEVEFRGARLSDQRGG